MGPAGWSLNVSPLLHELVNIHRRVPGVGLPILQFRRDYRTAVLGQINENLLNPRANVRVVRPECVDEKGLQVDLVFHSSLAGFHKQAKNAVNGLN